VSKAFISYSRSSESAVQKIREDLLRSGIDEVWWDKHLVGAQSWWDTILHQIRESDVVICLVDVGIKDSLAVRREYQYAVDLGKPLLPILLSSEINITTLPVELSGKQYVDYREENSSRASNLVEAIGNLPPPPPLPDPLPHAPEMPRSERDYLMERVSSTEPLSEEVQNAVLNQLRRLARSEDSEQREFARTWLTQLRGRRELYASVATDIDELSVKQRGNRTWVVIGFSFILAAGAAVAYLIQKSDIVALAVPTPAETISIEPEITTSSDTMPANGKVPSLRDARVKQLETNEPVDTTKISDPPAPESLAHNLAVPGLPVPESPVLESLVQNLNETLTPSIETAPMTSAPAPQDVSETLDTLKLEPETETETEFLISGMDTVAVPAVRWHRDFTIFEANRFKLCGYQGFSATTLKTDSDRTILKLRSTDRSIPDQPFRGFDKQVATNQIVELLPGCRVKFDHEITSGVARIRVRVKGDE